MIQLAETDLGTVVRLATEAELLAVRPLDAYDPSLWQTSEIHDYHIIAVVAPWREITLHVLGWCAGDGYITSTILAMGDGKVQTLGGKVHVLSRRSTDQMPDRTCMLMIRRAMPAWRLGTVIEGL